MSVKLFSPKADEAWDSVNSTKYDICYYSIVQSKAVNLVEYVDSLWMFADPNYYYTLEVKLYVHFKDILYEDS